MGQAYVQIGLRVSPATHKELRDIARKKDVPLNTYIANILEAHLAMQQNGKARKAGARE